MVYRPSAVAFDVIETLMPLAPLRDRLEGVGLPGRLLELRLVTGWISRLEGRYADIFLPPDVAGDDLVAVCERLLDLDSPGTSAV